MFKALLLVSIVVESAWVFLLELSLCVFSSQHFCCSQTSTLRFAYIHDRKIICVIPRAIISLTLRDIDSLVHVKLLGLTNAWNGFLSIESSYGHFHRHNYRMLIFLVPQLGVVVLTLNAIFVSVFMILALRNMGISDFQTSSGLFILKYFLAFKVFMQLLTRLILIEFYS